MNRKITIISICFALSLALTYKYFIRSSAEIQTNKIRQHVDVYNIIEFNNGLYGETNYQLHFSNLVSLEKYEMEVGSENTDNEAFIDSIQYSLAQLYYWLWESYSSAALLSSKLSIDLYISPPASVTNPKLPLRDTKKLNNHASHIVHSVLPELSNQLKTDNSSTHFSQFGAKLSDADCNSILDLQHDAVVQNDDNAFVIDPSIFGVNSSCYYHKAISLFQELINNKRLPKEQYLKIQLQYVVLMDIYPENSKDMNKYADQQLIEELQDSKNYELYSDQIFEVISILVKRGLVSASEALMIVNHSDFPYAELLLALMTADTQSSVKFLEDSQIPAWDEIISLDDPILAPKLVIKIAEYLDKKGEFMEGAILLNEFWFGDANSFPPTTWWFDNYPKFLLLSYSFGRLDGGRLPLWVENLHQISQDDELLRDLMELAKFYNLVAFL